MALKGVIYDAEKLTQFLKDLDEELQKNGDPSKDVVSDIPMFARTAERIARDLRSTEEELL